MIIVNQNFFFFTEKELKCSKFREQIFCCLISLEYKTYKHVEKNSFFCVDFLCKNLTNKPNKN